MRHTLKLNGIVIGWSNLEEVDAVDRRVWGQFHPGIGYDLVQPIFRLFAEATPMPGGEPLDQIKLIVPHQVNQRIIDSALERLKISPDKAYVNIDKYGNTSSASIPIALDEAVRAGKLGKGDVVIMVAFGAGLTWANAVVRM